MRVLHCPICGSRLTPKNRTLDHFIPKSRGGGSGLNRWPMCRRCNNKKGHRLPNEVETAAYKQWLQQQA